MSGQSEGPKPAERRRYGGSPMEFADLLRPLASSRNFVPRYCEAASVAVAKVEKDNIPAFHDKPCILKQASPNLSFVRSTVQKGLGILAKERGKEWQLQQEFVKQWIKVNCNRIMNVCRVVEQNDKKMHPPDWVMALPWRKTASQPVAVASCSAGHEEEEYLFGWDAEWQAAWRRRVGCKHKEPCVEVLLDGDEHDAPTAVFADGMRRAVPDTTIGALKAAQARRCSQRTAPFFET